MWCPMGSSDLDVAGQALWRSVWAWLWAAAAAKARKPLLGSAATWHLHADAHTMGHA